MEIFGPNGEYLGEMEEDENYPVENNNEINDDTIKSFTFFENGDVIYSPYNVTKATDKLVPGYYELDYDNYKHEYYIKRTSIKKIPKPFKFQNKNILDKYIDCFTNQSVKETLNKLNIQNKGGILFYGKEGTGKSTILQYYCSQLVNKNNAMVFYLNEENFVMCWKFLTKLKRIHKDTLFVVVIEEIDDLLESSSLMEDRLKSMLDGNLSLDNVLVFATTNYINKIPEALKNRPSRFKYSFEISELKDRTSVEAVVNNIIGNFECDKELIIKECMNKTLDYIQQYCLDIILNLTHRTDKKKISL